MTILYVDLYKEVDLLTKIVNYKADVELVKQRAKFVDLCLHDLEYKYNDTYSLAGSAYDLADANINRYEWTVGLTTEEIDSIVEIGTE